MAMVATALVAALGMEVKLSEGLVSILHNTTRFGSNSFAEVLLESKFTDLDGFHQFQQSIAQFDKTLTGVRLEIGDGDISTVELYIGVKQRLNDTAIWYGPFSVADGDNMIHTLGVEDAKLFALRIIDSSPQSLWQLSAIELFGEIGEGRE